MFSIRLRGPHDYIVESHDDLNEAIERCKHLRGVYIMSDYCVEDGHGFLMFPKGIKSAILVNGWYRHEEYDE